MVRNKTGLEQIEVQHSVFLKRNIIKEYHLKLAFIPVFKKLRHHAEFSPKILIDNKPHCTVNAILVKYRGLAIYKYLIIRRDVQGMSGH
jgi:hypothetical protein